MVLPIPCSVPPFHPAFHPVRGRERLNSPSLGGIAERRKNLAPCFSLQLISINDSTSLDEIWNWFPSLLSTPEQSRARHSQFVASKGCDSSCSYRRTRFVPLWLDVSTEHGTCSGQKLVYLLCFISLLNTPWHWIAPGWNLHQTNFSVALRRRMWKMPRNWDLSEIHLTCINPV